MWLLILRKDDPATEELYSALITKQNDLVDKLIDFDVIDTNVSGLKYLILNKADEKGLRMKWQLWDELPLMVEIDARDKAIDRIIQSSEFLRKPDDKRTAPEIQTAPQEQDIDEFGIDV